MRIKVTGAISALKPHVNIDVGTGSKNRLCAPSSTETPRKP